MRNECFCHAVTTVDVIWITPFSSALLGWADFASYYTEFVNNKFMFAWYLEITLMKILPRKDWNFCLHSNNRRET